MVILIRLEFKTDGLKVLFNSETVLGKADNGIVAETFQNAWDAIFHKSQYHLSF